MSSSTETRQGRKRKLDWAALRRAVEQRPYRPNTEWAAEFGVTHHAIRYALRQMKLLRRRRPAAATVRSALKFEEAHDFYFEAETKDRLLRLAGATSGDRDE
ncbi:MAG: IS630 transposase-related protein [Bryobacteraceae bacterium]